jgi:hypothetical protein
VSSERGRSTIKTATWASIQHTTYDGVSYPCGCYPSRKEPHLRFHLCDYHEGYDEGYALTADLAADLAAERAEVERLTTDPTIYQHQCGHCRRFSPLPFLIPGYLMEGPT